MISLDMNLPFLERIIIILAYKMTLPHTKHKTQKITHRRRPFLSPTVCVLRVVSAAMKKKGKKKIKEKNVPRGKRERECREF